MYDTSLDPTYVHQDDLDTTPHWGLENEWNAWIDRQMDLAVPATLDKATAGDLEHLALYHYVDGRYYGLAHRCTMTAGNEVF